MYKFFLFFFDPQKILIPIDSLFPYLYNLRECLIQFLQNDVQVSHQSNSPLLYKYKETGSSFFSMNIFCKQLGSRI